MLNKNLIRGALALTLVVTTGSALGDQPTRGGYRNSVDVSACAPEVASKASYRQAATRLRTHPSASWAGASAGYRDLDRAVPLTKHARRIAMAAGLRCVR